MKTSAATIRTPPRPPMKHASHVRLPPPPPKHSAVPAHERSSFGAPPPPVTTSRALPPPPNSGRAVMAPPRPPPPPPRSDAFHAAVPVSSQAAVSAAASNSVSPAFAQQVAQTPTDQLKTLASKLKMELVFARFTQNPARIADAQKKLTYVEGQMHQRQVKQELVSRFQYQRQVGGMSTEQLSAARSKEGQALFVAHLRGDAAGVKEAQAKLGILDGEMARREADLYKFQQSVAGMSDTQLDELGSKLGDQFAQVLFDPSTTGSQRDLVFNELASLIAEQVKRSIGGAVASAFAGCFGNDDARYSK